MSIMHVAAANYCAEHMVEQRCIDWMHTNEIIGQWGPWVIAAEIAVFAGIFIYQKLRKHS